jgi:alkylation response protein AidB-like acyl-CoA dehydrogenase
MIDLFPDTEQQQVVDSVKDVLARGFPLERLRAKDKASDAAALRQFGELGWFRLALPESAGGAGMDCTDEVLLHRELGRALLPPSLIAQSVAAQLVAQGKDKSLADSILDGRAKVGFAIPVARGVPLDGAELLVADGEGAELLLVCGGDAVALLRRADLAGLRRVSSLDDSVSLERGTVQGILSRASDTKLATRAKLLIAAQQLGVAEAARDMAAAYAKTRSQFGKPIGAFQAISHHCADMALKCEAALCQTLFAAIVQRDARDDAPFHAAAASLVAANAAFDNATLNIRVHGGMGFTADCDAQRYLKRAVLLRELGGGLPSHEATLLATRPTI